MSRSILQDEKECYLTQRTDNLHMHHVYPGTANRKLSDKYGCWVYLIGELHNQSAKGVHFNRELDLRLRRECQVAFEKIYGHEKFMQIFGRNYL